MRIAREKAHEQLTRFDIAALGEGIAGDDVAEFGGGAEDHAGTKAEFAFDGFFDAR